MGAQVLGSFTFGQIIDPQLSARKILLVAMASPWDCVCEFIRSQSANLQNVMESLANQNHFSDIDTTDTLTLGSGMSPLHLFMFLLLAVWGFLYVSGRQRQAISKPQRPPASSGGPEGSDSDGADRGGDGS